MRRKDRERDAAFAWEVLAKAPYATVSMVSESGEPYGVPVNLAVDRPCGVLYFHCAGAGKKWEILAQHPEVWVSAVSHMAVIPGEFTVSFDSAMAHGRAEIVRDEGEKVKALILLTESLDHRSMGGLSAHMEQCLDRTMIVKLVPDELTGKQKVKE